MPVHSENLLHHHQARNRSSFRTRNISIQDMAVAGLEVHVLTHWFSKICHIEFHCSDMRPSIKPSAKYCSKIASSVGGHTVGFKTVWIPGVILNREKWT